MHVSTNEMEAYNPDQPSFDSQTIFRDDQVQEKSFVSAQCTRCLYQFFHTCCCLLKRWENFSLRRWDFSVHFNSLWSVILISVLIYNLDRYLKVNQFFPMKLVNRMRAWKWNKSSSDDVHAKKIISSMRNGIYKQTKYLTCCCKKILFIDLRDIFINVVFR